MDDGCGLSAPEQVEQLRPLWEPLSRTEQERLAWRWVDLSVRDALPRLFERHGRADDAGLLWTLAPVLDMGALVRAEVVLAQVAQSTPVELGAALYNALAFLDDLERGLLIGQACFLAVMTSRLVYGDDRLVQTMREDVGRAAR